MATRAQIRANRRNARCSTGPVSLAAKQASSRNSWLHGLNHRNKNFYFLAAESEEKFQELQQRLLDEHQPASLSERVFLRRMAEHEWLRNGPSSYLTFSVLQAEVEVQEPPSSRNQLRPRTNRAEAVVNPELGQFFLRAVLRETRAEVAELHLIERLILIKAGKDHGLFTGHRILVHLQALGADLFHHALHG